jgi:serine/threonine-protein kinase
VNENTRWYLIKDLFKRAQQQPENDRDAWLQDHCGGDGGLAREVRALLTAQRGSHDLLDRGAIDAIREMGHGDATADLAGQRIGAYRLLRLVGQGGMGSVYLAEREEGDFKQRAALKLVRTDFLSDEARARFLRERRILAQLTHPHIAQLHDGGVAANGAPYFTLEFVEGEPITKYCDARKLAIRDRLTLVLQVCAAVAYAHRNLIVHRDLKPSNIFVTTDGEVKLLDFGIAKLLDAEPSEGRTETHARMMTPEYASPEQVLGEPITTATDVYAIGVLLYELLSGRLPYARADAGTISWSKAVVEETPEPVYRALARATTRKQSTTGDCVAAARGIALPALRRSLRGDLDRILQRALAKAPEARYATVGALARDLTAYLDGHAISGGTRTHQMRKFVRRHWLPLAAALLIIAIVFGSGIAIVRQSRQVAREAENTLQVKDFLYGLFTAVDPRAAKGRVVSANELLDRGAERVQRNTTLDPEQRAEIEATLGRIYYQLGLSDKARDLQQNALKVFATGAASPRLVAKTQAEYADTLTNSGDLKAAAAIADEAWAKIQTQPDAKPAERANILHAQARIALAQRDFVKTKNLSDEELVIGRRISADDPMVLFRALMAQGGAFWGLAQPHQAEATWREALSVASADAGADSLEVAMAQQNLALALQVESHYAEAKALEESALATDKKMLGPEHSITLGVQQDLALADFRMGQYAEARALMEKTAAAQRAGLGADHPAVAGTEINLGNALLDSGDADAAEHVLTDAVAIFEKKYGRDYQGVRLALGDLASAHIAQGKLDQAQAELLEVLDREKKAGTPEMGDFIDHYRLGDVKRLQHDFKSAIELQQAALAASQKDNGENSRYTAGAHQYLAASLHDSGDAVGAEREYRAALASYSGYLPNGEHPKAADAHYELAMLLLKREGMRDEGIRDLSTAADIFEKFLGADDPKTRQARDALRKAQGNTKT